MLWATACAHALRLPDLAAVAGGRAVLGGELPGVRRAERVEHLERGLVAGRKAGLRLGRSRPRVLLEELVRELAPPGALPDQLHLGLALAAHRALDERRERRDGARRDLAQRRPLVAEDAGIAVLVGADRRRRCPCPRAPAPGCASGARCPGTPGRTRRARTRSRRACARPRTRGRRRPCRRKRSGRTRPAARSRGS